MNNDLVTRIGKSKLGIRAQAQQNVLARGISHFSSWRDVSDEIRKEESALKARTSMEGQPHEGAKR